MLGYHPTHHLPRLNKYDQSLEETVPLSEEELRLLEQMERALVAEDPKLASTLRGTAMRRRARRQLVVAVVCFLLGVTILMTGAVARLTVVGIAGFVVMLASAYVGLTAWRGKSPLPFQPRDPGPDQGVGLSVIQGGKKARRPGTRGATDSRRGGPRGSMMDRFEERWRRRRDRDQGF